MLSLVVIVVIFVGVLPRVADFSKVRATLAEMTWLEGLAGRCRGASADRTGSWASTCSIPARSLYTGAPS